jgi:alkylated DNA nucleotide flippase Atl1
LRTTASLGPTATQWGQFRPSFSRLTIGSPILLDVTRERSRSVGSEAVPFDDRKARHFIANVPEGFWTAYMDVGEVAGAIPRFVGWWLWNSGGSVAHYWRVLTYKGEVPKEFRGGGPGPLTAADARDRLRREGVWIDGPAALLQKQRFTLEDYVRVQSGGGVRQVKRAPAPAARPAQRVGRAGEVRLGATIRARDVATGDVKTWTLIPDGRDRRENELPIGTPVGKALLGHTVGEVVVVELPKGSRSLAIEEVIS